MYNPLLNLNREYDESKRDVLAGLRSEIQFWLTKPNHSQDILAKRSGISPQMLCDVLANRRGCSPETYGKIVTALRCNGARFENVQVYGQPVESRTVNIAEFEAEHTATHLNRIQKSGRNHNANTTFSGKE